MCKAIIYYFIGDELKSVESGLWDDENKAKAEAEYFFSKVRPEGMPVVNTKIERIAA